jgi:hypothetical protein
MAKSDDRFASKVRYITNTIAAGTTSAVIPLRGMWLLRVVLPASFASTSMKIATSDAADGTFTTIYDAGADKSWTIAASKNVNVSDLRIIANYFQVTFGTSETAMTVTYVAVPI